MTYGDSVLLAFLLHSFLVNVQASIGDRSFSFRKCIRICEVDCRLEGRVVHVTFIHNMSDVVLLKCRI